MSDLASVRRIDSIECRARLEEATMKDDDDKLRWERANARFDQWTFEQRKRENEVHEQLRTPRKVRLVYETGSGLNIHSPKNCLASMMSSPITLTLRLQNLGAVPLTLLMVKLRQMGSQWRTMGGTTGRRTTQWHGWTGLDNEQDPGCRHLRDQRRNREEHVTRTRRLRRP